MQCARICLLYIVLIALDTCASTSVPLTRRPARVHSRSRSGPHVHPAAYAGRPGHRNGFSAQSIPLEGAIASFGKFYAPIRVGGQELIVHVDSGSSSLAIPDSDCEDCPQDPARPPYSVFSSTSLHSIVCNSSGCPQGHCSPINGMHTMCHYQQQFGDGSWIAGVSASEEIEFGVYQARATFGRIIYQDPNFSVDRSEGILGLAYSSINCVACVHQRDDCSPMCTPTLFDAFSSKYAFLRRFGLCFDSESQDSGVLDIGSFNTSRLNSSIKYVPVLPDQTGRGYQYYSVRLQSVTDARTHAQILPATTAIIDSGTSSIAAPYSFILQFQSWCMINGCPKFRSVFNFSDSGFPHSVDMTDTEASLYPDLEFRFDNSVVVVLKWHHYLLEPPNSYDKRVLGMTIIEERSDDHILLGLPFLQATYTALDQESNQVGFAPVKPGACYLAPNPPNEESGGEGIDPLLAAGAGGGVVFTVIVAIAVLKRRRRKAREAREARETQAGTQELPLLANQEDSQPPQDDSDSYNPFSSSFQQHVPVTPLGGPQDLRADREPDSDPISPDQDSPQPPRPAPTPCEVAVEPEVEAHELRAPEAHDVQGIVYGAEHQVGVDTAVAETDEEASLSLRASHDHEDPQGVSHSDNEPNPPASYIIDL